MLFAENRAAQYVRMSTDMQRNSIAIQAETIALYAARRGLIIVRSYEDAGRSGVTIGGRSALQTLISDVRSGSADFRTILIYDVSRWGRFQDTDESAYYEFICRSNGVAVEYCAEQFNNDGSLTATILKNLKRAMAGEYSRELSAKVFAGQAKAVRNGFHRGSTPGYGLRRCLIEDGSAQRTILKPGQRKRLSTDRTILVAGPAEEIEIIARIYSLFIDQKFSLSRIARLLNEEGIANVLQRQWNDVSVREILSNEKYVGSAQFNKTSRKLGAPSRKNLRSEWVEKIGAFEGIVSKERFRQAQEQLRYNARAYLDSELLNALTAIWCSRGRISAALIESIPEMPSVNTFKEHFGGLAAAYQMIGYAPPFRRGRSSQVRMVIMSQMSARLRAAGCEVEWHSGSSQILINEELVVAVVAGCATPGGGKNQWQIKRSAWAKPDILVAARVHDEVFTVVEDYLFIPLLFLTNASWLTISKKRRQRMEAFRSATLDPLFALCSRKRIGLGNASHA
ncbi:recombinase family protein [Tardiphaga sp. P9-11]|uniref:recombinase family protein n=1 Tax=Tardiphaga sp. P9-11 TaxID=2024614 RepID=UPI0011F39D43|nr:recombinase family protein [Tardiphaga sp. P9-11]KAA0072509.1 recombinase family protein [Tardiphaga sp. P9-11]